MMHDYMFNSPIGLLKLSEENGLLTGLSLLREEPDTGLPSQFERHSDLLYEAYRQINEYFAGTRKRFELPTGGRGTAFQKLVWNALKQIPYGETRSYAEIAAEIGNPKAVRAVGQANNHNPLLIIVPCHRVIHKNGDITGFGCGTAVKKYLLELERRNQDWNPAKEGIYKAGK